MKIAWSNWGQAEGNGLSRCLATCWSSEPAGYYRHYPSELNHHPSEPRLLSQPKPNIISLYKYLWSQRYTEVILLCWIIMKGALCHIYLHCHFFSWNLKRKSTEPFNRQWWIFKNANKPKEPYNMLHNNVNSTIGIYYHRYLVFLGYICGTFCVWLPSVVPHLMMQCQLFTTLAPACALAHRHQHKPLSIKPTFSVQQELHRHL